MDTFWTGPQRSGDYSKLQITKMKTEKLMIRHNHSDEGTDMQIYYRKTAMFIHIEGPEECLSTHVPAASYGRNIDLA
jgi:hypothetical protein